MVIVTGRVVVSADHLDEVIEIGLEHVVRSRTEPGCLFHSIHRDVEDPGAVVFLERWADLDALHAHFRVPASIAFARRLGELATDPPELVVYEATRVDPRGS